MYLAIVFFTVVYSRVFVCEQHNLLQTVSLRTEEGGNGLALE